MPVFVVRHAKAGDRHRWDGDDRERPLTKSGRAQADGLVRVLDDYDITALRSSPFLRCMQTLEPLAAKHGMTIDADERLAEAARIEDALDLVLASPDGTVLCSHGDLIPEIISRLYHRGMELTNDPDWRKGTTWVLERDGEGFARATVLPPPA